MVQPLGWQDWQQLLAIANSHRSIVAAMLALPNAVERASFNSAPKAAVRQSIPIKSRYAQRQLSGVRKRGLYDRKWVTLQPKLMGQVNSSSSGVTFETCQSVFHPTLDILREEVNGSFQEILQQNEWPKLRRVTVRQLPAPNRTQSKFVSKAYIRRE